MGIGKVTCIGYRGNNLCYEVACETCGKVRVLRLYQLGNVTECISCSNKRNGIKNRTHGMYAAENKHHAWHNWCDMTRRGRMESGRYSSVDCSPLYVDSFEEFSKEIGEKPYPEATVDRIDNSKGYVPGNIRWVSKTEQTYNRRQTVWVRIKDKRLPFRTASRELGVPIWRLEKMIKDKVFPDVELLGRGDAK